MGAHLPFHEDLPTWAMDAGADVCVVSVHKMGAGFEQGSVFHVQGDLIDRDRLSACADLLMTTSPNVLIYAAMDGWRRQMVQHGHQLLGAALDLARQVRDEIELIPDVEVLDDELLGVQASHDLDRMQVLIDVCGTGTSGYQAADWLREHARIDVGMSDHRRILATLSMADDKETLGRLTDALRAWRTAAQDFDPAPGSRCRRRPKCSWRRSNCRATRFSGGCRRCRPKPPPAGSPPNRSRPIPGHPRRRPRRAAQ